MQTVLSARGDSDLFLKLENTFMGIFLENVRLPSFLKSKIVLVFFKKKSHNLQNLGIKFFEQVRATFIKTFFFDLRPSESDC